MWMAAQRARFEREGSTWAYAPEEITAQLADYVANTDATHWPASVQHEALRSFFNIVGCTIGGARHGMVDLADKTLGAFAGPDQATYWAAEGKRIFCMPR